MPAADRRMGIVSILVACGHATTRELAQEFGVSRRTIIVFRREKPARTKIESPDTDTVLVVQAAG